MEREIVLSSFSVKNQQGNRPGDFTTRFTPTIYLHDNANYYIALNRIITLAFTCTKVNSGYNNQEIAFSKDNGKTWTDINFTQGVWDYQDFDKYIKEKTKTTKSEGKNEYPINLTFDDIVFCMNYYLRSSHELVFLFNPKPPNSHM